MDDERWFGIFFLLNLLEIHLTTKCVQTCYQELLPVGGYMLQIGVQQQLPFEMYVRVEVIYVFIAKICFQFYVQFIGTIGSFFFKPAAQTGAWSDAITVRAAGFISCFKYPQQIYLVSSSRPSLALFRFHCNQLINCVLHFTPTRRAAEQQQMRARPIQFPCDNIAKISYH